MEKPTKTREELEAELEQRKIWYKRVLKDIQKRKRLGLSEIDNMLDIMNMIKEDIHDIEELLNSMD
jgi:hypothetical protein